MKESLNLPVQVEALIRNLLNSKENIHIRNNYRQSLDAIRVEAEKAIRKFDNEYATVNMERKRK